MMSADLRHARARDKEASGGSRGSRAGTSEVKRAPMLELRVPQVSHLYTDNVCAVQAPGMKICEAVY
jgi:hypothetical protein